MNRSPVSIGLMVAALVLALGVSACGRKGPLESPSEASKAAEPTPTPTPEAPKAP